MQIKIENPDVLLKYATELSCPINTAQLQSYHGIQHCIKYIQ